MKKEKLLAVIGIVFLIIVMAGVSYAAYIFSAEGTKENTITTGTLSISYSQNSFIDLRNTYPKTDIYAIATKEDRSSMSFSVSMESSGNKTINYALALTEIQEGTTLKSDKVKIYLEKGTQAATGFTTNKGELISSFENKYVEGLIDSYAIYQDVLTTSNETHNYTLTAWIDENYILPIKNETTTTKQTNKETYKFKVKVVGVDTPITIEDITAVTGIGSQVIPTLTNNKGNSGLYTITHNVDSTLQIGATETITEYRYRGASPKNYVTFNNETWRIIGAFPTDDGTGNIENRIKIIKDQSIGNKYWNGSIVSSTSSYNNWTGATLKEELNGTYYNRLDSTSQSMIGNAKYYLGGYSAYTQSSVNMYSYERKISGSSYYYGSNPNNWVGKIGLMYVSDYGYASSNCETKSLYNSSSSSNDLRACNDTNWLYNGAFQWLLPQFSSYSNYAFDVHSSGRVSLNDVGSNQRGVRPVLYLASAVQITGGSGTSSSPYTLGR